MVELIRHRTPRGSGLARVVEPLAWAIWIQRGATLPMLRYVRRHGRTVSAGPFRGLRYPRSAILHVPGLPSKLAGTYELELHDPIEALVQARPEAVVNIGAGEGYYAIGIARRLPEATIIAYEADPYNARALDELAAANAEAAQRVELRGHCAVEQLAALDLPDGTPVICDCEGDEEELIDPSRVGWLAGSPLVVEVHDSFRPGLELRLRERLAATHSVEVVRSQKRYLEDHPSFSGAIKHGLSPIQVESLMDELRPWRTPWLIATPRRR